VDGTAGAFDVLDILHRELAAAMRLCGRPTLASIDRDLVR